jgi:ABC-2 type transport system ATP-binding protein
MVENPSRYGHLTGRENLQINQKLCDLPRSAIDRVLEITNMAEDADRITKQYSLGMKQRIGLALALLSEPDLLILDEPTNGLDPAGIREIRDLICQLPQQTGLTVFLSSHMLSEVQQMASHVGILSKGRLLFEGSMGELQRAHKPQVQLEVNPVERAYSALQNSGWEVERTSGNLMKVALESFDQSAELARFLIENGIDLLQLKRIELSLEELFLDMTEEPTVGGT